MVISHAQTSIRREPDKALLERPSWQSTERSRSELLWKSPRRTLRRERDVRGVDPMFFLTFILTFEYLLANFEGLVLGCIEAEFCKQILV